MFDISEKIIGVFETLIKWMFDSVIEPFLGLSHLKDLIYGKADGGNLIWGTFRPSDLTDALAPLSYSMQTLAAFVLVSFIAIYGMRVSEAVRNPLRRNEFITFIYELIFIVFLLFNLPFIYDLLFNINQLVVNLFNGAYESNLDTLNEDQSEKVDGVLGYILVQLVMLGLSIWANFYYFMRKVTLIILMAMGPLMLVFYMNQKFKGMTGGWAKELIGSIFVQSIHAFVFWTVATVSATSNGLIETVIIYVIFIPISEGIRGLLGMGGGMQGNFSKAGAMLGLAGLTGMYGAVKGAMGDKSVMGALKGAYAGAKGGGSANGTGEKGEGDALKDVKDKMGANAGSDIGTSSKAEKMLKAGDLMSRSGKAVLGMAGAVSGMALGPVAAIAGASAGSAVGGVVGGVTGRGLTALGQGAADGIGNAINRIGKGAEAGKKALKDRDGSNLEENLANVTADRDTANWADQNRESVMNDLKERFPDATPKQLESHFNDIKNKKREGFYADSKAQLSSLKEKGMDMAGGNQMVEASSSAMAEQWGKDNQASFFENYDKQHPKKAGESDGDFMARRMNAFNDKKAEVKNAFADSGQKFIAQRSNDGNDTFLKSDFKDHMNNSIGTMQGLGNTSNLANASNNSIDHVTGAGLFDNASNKPNKADGAMLVKASSKAMANQWAKENEHSFLANYEKEQPQLAGETDAAFSARKVQAFNDKKAQVQENFTSAGQQYVDNNSNGGTVPISKTAFQKHMKSAVSEMTGMENPTSIINAGNKAVENVVDPNIAVGKPNVPFIVGGMANAKTEQMKEAFINQKVSAGTSRTAAVKDWVDNHQVPTHQANVQMVKENLDQASKGIVFRSSDSNVASKIADYGASAKAFTSTVAGIPQLKEMSQNISQAGVAGFHVNKEKGLVPAVMGFTKESYKAGMAQIVEQQGGVVEAQSNFQNAVGYTAGVVMGQKGYQIGKQVAAHTLSPFKGQVQETIQSPSEVIQMARTVTDPHGNVQVAPGAIRQVVKQNESYIEVQTKSGTTEIVSRKGSGHSGLGKGEVVYQDLTVADDSLVVSKSKGSQASTYRLDSGGARIPSSVNVTQNPVSLLSNAVHGSQKAAPVQQEQLPIYNQKVDSGNFKVEELAANGLENPRVVVEKNRQFVVAQKGGVDYRVSQIFSGDTRMESTEKVEIPVQAKGSQLRPINPVPNSEYGVHSSNQTPYYSSKSVEGLMVDVGDMMESKHMDHANRTTEKRRAIDQVRRKQGLLG